MVYVLYTKRIQSLVIAKKNNDSKTVKSDYAKIILMTIACICMILIVETIGK